MSAASAALVSAESILALTPIAIKKTPLDPISAIWSRLLSSAVLGYALTGDRDLPRSEWPQAAALGYTNLLHVATSYESFRNLQAGQAMSLLYTYPLWIIIFGCIFNREEIRPHEYGFIGGAAVGSALLNMDPGTVAPTPLGRTANSSWGVIMGLLMAITEAGMHTLLKGLKWRDPAKSVWVVNSSASIWLGLALFVQNIFVNGTDNYSLKGSWLDIILLTAFHSLTMFSGYWLRFFAVPRLSTVSYAILSYAGLLASYLFGAFFLGERPGWLSMLGAAIIVGSGLALQLAPGKIFTHE